MAQPTEVSSRLCRCVALAAPLPWSSTQMNRDQEAGRKAMERQGGGPLLLRAPSRKGPIQPRPTRRALGTSVRNQGSAGTLRCSPPVLGLATGCDTWTDARGGEPKNP